jgi:hypothetical protein
MKYLSTKNLTGVGLAALALLAAVRPAMAQGWIEPDTHRFLPGQAVERVRSDVLITIDAERRVALVEIEEVFRNRTGALMEGDYVYPIPPEAVFTAGGPGALDLRGDRAAEEGPGADRAAGARHAAGPRLPHRAGRRASRDLALHAALGQRR